MKTVGTPIDRVDAKRKVTGTADYAADIEVAKVAHAVIVTSTVAKGYVSAIDVVAARAQPGVIAVLTHRDAPRVDAGKEGEGPTERVLQLLQGDGVVYNDQPIAVVVADTLERAQHAASLVVARYQPEPAVASIEQAMATAYAPSSTGPLGPADTRRGDVAMGRSTGTIEITQTYTTPNENHNPMEPHATIAVWNAPDQLTLYDATQGIFGVRSRIAQVFGLSAPRVRVIDHYVGGGFGCKGTPWSHVALAALAAKAVQRPVKLVLTRTQMFSLVGHRPHTVQTVLLAADREGHLTATRHDVVSETSRIDEFTEPCSAATRMLYACPHLATTQRLVRVDAPTPTFMRAPGEASGTFALESAMDELAVALKIDPVELRVRNHATKNPEDGKPWSSKSLLECYRAAAARFGWTRRDPRPRSMRDGRELVGYGMATAVYPTRIRGASARARRRPDGTFLVQAGTQDLGTGTYTVMTQVAADALGVPVDRVTFELGDTTLPEAPVSGGSATVTAVSPAVRAACLALVAKLKGMRPEDTANIEISAEAKTEGGPDHDKYSSHAFGADFVEVRVDEDLGIVRVARVVAAFAAGTILNPKTARSQYIGGLVFAIGMALEENTVRDRRNARVMTRDLADYHVPVHADVPRIDVILVDEVEKHTNSLGTKGIGEIGITGATAAIANAVYHATGKRIRDLPITLDKLL